MPCKMTPAQRRAAMRAHLALEAGMNDELDHDGEPVLIAKLLEAMGHEDDTHPLSSLDLDGIDVDATIILAQHDKLITVKGSGAKRTLELTTEGRKVLAQSVKPPKTISRKTTTDNTPNQEDDMAKDKKTKPKAKADKGERTPNANSHRWVAIQAMKANPGATRDQITAICMKSNGGTVELWAKRIARARRFAKKSGVATLGALGKPAKAEKPAKAPKAKKEAKADKPKLKTKKAAAGTDLLG